MNISAIRIKAKEVGVKAMNLKKDDLVRAIQEKEGNVVCFKTGVDSCPQYDCLWREDCIKN
jgi:hypothetical protein